ncbi:hypothetical protein D915_009470 [Fasciola hepatica]|uniref:B box-type domain-containing protein n=1 Tax=Fasciola hepatica TaxID=6192 RepID=A0A4E0QVZ0_FASHE|nr:hypothetical protein D915_009470 [Fasciola hepatica]
MKKNDRASAIRKTQKENKILEEETRKMEQRLHMLKNALYKDVPREVKSSNSSVWEASTLSTGPQSLKGTEGKLDLAKTKLKMLKRENIKRRADNKYAELLKKVTGAVQHAPEPVANNSVAPKCGQCENKPAVVSCQECSEEYCAKCFAQFHMKGALRRHHSLPLSASRNAVRQAIQESSNELETEANSIQMQSQACQSEGNVTKRASSTVQTACGDNTHITSSKQCESRSTSVERKTEPPPPAQIEFTPTLSYAERLLVHRNRWDPISCRAKSNTGDEPNSKTANFSDLCVEEEEDIPVINPGWNRPTFEELHRLATQDLNPSEFYNLCKVDQLEHSVIPTSSNTSVSGGTINEDPSDLKTPQTDLPPATPVRKQTENEIDEAYTNHHILPESSVPSLDPEKSAGDLILKPKRDEQNWHPGVTYSTHPDTANELNTIELIKQHLYRMTADHK